MASDNEKILKRLKNVGNPMFLLRLLNSGTKFVSSHQMAEKAHDTSRLFLDISTEYFEFHGKKLTSIDKIPAGSALIRVSRDAVENVAKIINSDADDVNVLFKDLRRSRNIKKYALLLDALDKDCQMNIQLTQLVKFAF